MKRIFLLFLFFVILIPSLPAKKIRQTLHVEKESKKKSPAHSDIEGLMVILNDSLPSCGDINLDKEELSALISFSGYEKECNSSFETFILSNGSRERITGFEVRVDYLDMNRRKLHSREIRESCDIPAGETRRFDVKSWDRQHTYYYYLGNLPKKVAIPYQVSFVPVAFWIER